MLHLTRLHRLAAARGDGLRPELLALLDRHQENNTTDLNLAVIHGETIAGAHPQPRLDGALPENVVRFRPRSAGSENRAG